MGGPAGWPQPQWQSPPPGSGQESSGKALASLVLGICGLVVCPIILSVIGLVLGYQARGEIERSGGRITGDGQAKAGIILSWVGLVLWGLFLLVMLATMLSFGGFETDSGFTSLR